MFRSGSLPALLLFVLLAGCNDDPDQPAGGTIAFPAKQGDVWMYTTTTYDSTGQQVGSLDYDTARVVGTFTLGGRTGTRISTGHIQILDTSKSGQIITYSSYEDAAYSVDRSALYSVVDIGDSSSLFAGRRWIRIADESMTNWAVLDTTVSFSTSSGTSTQRLVMTGARGGERTVNVKGQDHVGREYTLTITYTMTEPGGAVQTAEQRVHYWITPDLGILAFKAEPGPGYKTYEQVLTDYTIQ